MSPEHSGNSAALRSEGQQRNRETGSNPQLLSFLLPICGIGLTAILRRPAAATICRSGATCPRPDGRQRRPVCASFQCAGRDAAHLTPLTVNLGLSRPKSRRFSWPRLSRKGLMATGRTNSDAIPNSGCPFVFSRPGAFALHIHGGVRAATRPGAQRASFLDLYASHGATPGGPACRSVGVGARRRGVPLHGYQENAGGWHPPGRNTHRRH